MKKFFKSRIDKKVCGVCGGVAAALGIDSTIVRVLFVTSMFFSLGTTLIVYFVAALCLSESDVEVMDNTIRRIYRSNKDKKIFGVCGGIAEYFSIDAFILRMIFVFSVLFLGFGILTYIVFALVLPRESIDIK